MPCRARIIQDPPALNEEQSAASPNGDSPELRTTVGNDKPPAWMESKHERADWHAAEELRRNDNQLTMFPLLAKDMRRRARLAVFR